jgi:hypothetical protein
MSRYDKFLLVHCHTTGINFDSEDITLNKQPLSVALGVVDNETLKMISSVNVRIAFDKAKYTWDDKLSSIHGITREDRDEGESFADAAAILGEFIYENFGAKDTITVMGYNPLTFHVPFLNKILLTEELAFKFDRRDIDLFPIMALLGKYSAKEVFETFDVDTSEPLSSLENIKTYLKIYKTIRSIVKEQIDG